MKKVVGFLLVVAIFATPVSPFASALSVGLGWLLWRQCSRTLAAQQKAAANSLRGAKSKT